MTMTELAAKRELLLARIDGWTTQLDGEITRKIEYIKGLTLDSEAFHSHRRQLSALEGQKAGLYVARQAVEEVL